LQPKLNASKHLQLFITQIQTYKTFISLFFLVKIHLSQVIHIKKLERDEKIKPTYNFNFKNEEEKKRKIM